MDARILRTRTALLAAGVELVAERDTDDISMNDIATRAGVSRQVVYAHFADREHVLAAAAVARIRDAIIRSEDGPTRIPTNGTPPRTLIALMTHLVEHCVFYRRMMSGRTATLVREELTEHHKFYFERLMELPGHGDGLSRLERSELVIFLAGGSTAVIVDWLTGEAPLGSPRRMAGRLWKLWNR